MSPRRTLHLLTLALVVTAGCVGSPLGSPPSPTDERPDDREPTSSTPLPGSPVDFPDGPKDRPPRPTMLNESSVRDYVRTFEYRLAYNRLWYGNGSDVSLDCGVDSVSERSFGYTAVVTCSGYSNTRGTASSSATQTTLHADWGSRSFRYRVSANATGRVSVAR